MNGLQEHLIADPISPWQIAWNLMLLAIGLLVAYGGYRRGSSAGTSTTTTKVQEFAISGAAQFTDMNPIRDLVKTTHRNAEMMERCAIALEMNARANQDLGEIIREYIEETAIERRIERETKARVHAAMSQGGQS